jgi:hypothetical protein
LLVAGALALWIPTQARSAPVCATTWTGAAADGLWQTALNWSAGVPNSGVDACITLPGANVFLRGGASAQSLQVGGPTGTSTLHIEGSGSGNGTLNLAQASTITSHGVVSMDSTNGNYSLLDGAGLLTNQGQFNTTQGSGGTRYMRVSLTNAAAGTVSIGATDTRQDQGTTTNNNGAWNVLAGGVYSLTGGTTFNNNAGTMSIADPSGLKSNSATFKQHNTNATGAPILLLNSNLNMTGTGAAKFLLHQTNILSGTIAAAQTVTSEGAADGNSLTRISGNVTNAGTFVMDSTNGNWAQIFPDSGTPLFTNTGTLKTLGTLGTRYWRVNLTNPPGGTVQISASDTLQDQGTITNNGGSWNVLAGGVYKLTSATTFNNNAGTMSIADPFALRGNGVTFKQLNTNATGAPILLLNSNLNMTGTGAAKFLLHQTNILSGTIAAGQTVTTEGSSDGDAATTVSGTVTNAGTFALDSTNGNYAMVKPGVVTDSLTNTGTFKTVQGSGGPRYVWANLTNAAAGTVQIANNDTRQSQATVTNNSGAWNMPSGGVYSVSSGATFNNIAGTMSITDPLALNVNSSTFQQKGTAITGGPVLLRSNSTLAMTGSGPGAITLHQSNAVGGAIAAGQTVTVEGSTDGDSIMNASTGLTNAGTLAMNSTTGNYAMIQPSVSGDVLNNTGTFKALAGAGGPRYIRMAINNQTGGVMQMDAGDIRQDANTPTTNAGTFKLASAAVFNMSGGSSFTQSAGGNFVTNVDVANTQVGRIQGAGATPVSLAGKLTVFTVGTPALNSNWTVVGATTRSGTFATYNMNNKPYNVLYPADGFMLHTNPLLVIVTPSPLPNAAPGVAYSKTLVAASGIPPRTWSLASGTLPPGLTLSAAGVISGTPTTPGTSTFTAKVTDSTSPPPQVKTRLYTLTVDPWCPASTFPANLKAASVVTQGQPTGVYIWITPNGVWHLVSTRTGAGTQNFSGTVTTTGTIKQATGNKLENTAGNIDTFSLNPAKTQLTFAFQTGSDVDGVDFATSCTGNVTFNLKLNNVQLATAQIYRGAAPHTHPATNPFTVTLPSPNPITARRP